MRKFEDYNPFAVAFYFLAVTGIGMFCMDPAILFLSLAGGIVCFFLHCGLSQGKTHLYMLLLFLGMSLINPLISHNGKTVLFVMNHNPVTLEALLYGVTASAMIIGTLYWFRSFSRIMTSDKLLYLFGGLSPKLALILSMALRYGSLFVRQARKIRQTQRALGLYRDDNLPDNLRGGLQEFSILVTWTLENGIITADSMSARGYGTGKRSQYTLYGWRKGDWLLAVVSVALAAVTLFAIHSRHVVFYPQIAADPVTAKTAAGYVAYGILAFLPALIQGKEAIRWRCLMSKI